MWKKLQDYFTDSLWNFPLKEIKGARYYLYKGVRTLYLVLRGFFEDRCSLRAASLTYYTLLSIVPVLAISFAIAKGFGFRDYLQEEVLLRFKEQKEIFQMLIGFVDNLLEKTEGGVITGVGTALLFWSVLKVLAHIESAFNVIWQVKKARSWARKFSEYFSMMLIVPVFFIVSSSTTVFIVSRLQGFIENLPIYTELTAFLIFLLKLLPYCLVWVFFTFIYLFIPHTKVRFSSALLAGFIAGTLYQLLQWGYLYFQIGMTRYSAIYGSFAAIPLFLIWLQMSWIIILTGAEMSFSFQNMERFEFEKRCQHISYNYRMVLSLWVMHRIVEQFLDRKPPLTFTQLHQDLNIPSPLLEEIIEELIHANLLISVQTNGGGYQPRVSVENLRISDVIGALQNHGYRQVDSLHSSILEKMEGVLKTFQEDIVKSSHNRLIKEIKYE